MNKIATDLVQSRKLAEILPIKTADMWYKVVTPMRIENNVLIQDGDKYFSLELCKEENLSINNWEWVPAWSLSALLGALSKDYCPHLSHDCVSWTFKVTINCDGDKTEWEWHANDPIDAAFKLIELLHDKNLI